VAIENDSRIKNIVGPTILLQGGTYFDFLDPQGSVFSIEDIAHGLSLTCRFAGQCREFYSVAEHSIYVSQIVPPEHAFDALMHDAAEAFLGDVSRPLKSLLPDYKAIEKRVERAVAAAYGVTNPLPQAIKDADMRMLLTEQRQLMPNRDRWPCTDGHLEAPFQIACLPPARAKAWFLDVYAALRAKTGA
jgi:hypothetical protein